MYMLAPLYMLHAPIHTCMHAHTCTLKVLIFLSIRIYILQGGRGSGYLKVLKVPENRGVRGTGVPGGEWEKISCACIHLSTRTYIHIHTCTRTCWYQCIRTPPDIWACWSHTHIHTPGYTCTSRHPWCTYHTQACISYLKAVQELASSPRITIIT